MLGNVGLSCNERLWVKITLTGPQLPWVSATGYFSLKIFHVYLSKTNKNKTKTKIHKDQPRMTDLLFSFTGIPLSTKLSPAQMLVFDTGLAVVALALMCLVSVVGDVIMWIAAALAGLATATEFISGVLWASKYVTAFDHNWKSFWYFVVCIFCNHSQFSGYNIL